MTKSQLKQLFLRPKPHFQRWRIINPIAKDISGLLERVTIQPKRESVEIELEGAHTAMIRMAQNNESHSEVVSEELCLSGAGRLRSFCP